jgi:hypothetical protein
VYLNDVREFEKSGKYPFQLRKTCFFERVQYDIALLLSVVLTEPRHRIMKACMREALRLNKDALILGIGTGLELELIQSSENPIEICAYDIEVSPFIRKNFKELQVHEQEYTGQHSNCEAIFAIELLEHLSDPLGFCELIHESLEIGGRFVTTTAKNIPQQDHLYNFDNDEDFESELIRIGFRITEKEKIKHKSLFNDINSANTFYVLTRV